MGLEFKSYSILTWQTIFGYNDASTQVLQTGNPRQCFKLSGTRTNVSLSGAESAREGGAGERIQVREKVSVFSPRLSRQLVKGSFLNFCVFSVCLFFCLFVCCI